MALTVSAFTEACADELVALLEDAIILFLLLKITTCNFITGIEIKPLNFHKNARALLKKCKPTRIIYPNNKVYEIYLHLNNNINDNL
ncbi:MAG: hypothetical protein ACJA11_000525 [Glaciecola sp.]|jgi:hypothetical protein